MNTRQIPGFIFDPQTNRYFPAAQRGVTTSSSLEYLYQRDKRLELESLAQKSCILRSFNVSEGTYKTKLAFENFKYDRLDFAYPIKHPIFYDKKDPIVRYYEKSISPDPSVPCRGIVVDWNKINFIDYKEDQRPFIYSQFTTGIESPEIFAVNCRNTAICIFGEELIIYDALLGDVGRKNVECYYNRLKLSDDGSLLLLSDGEILSLASINASDPGLSISLKTLIKRRLKNKITAMTFNPVNDSFFVANGDNIINIRDGWEGDKNGNGGVPTWTLPKGNVVSKFWFAKDDHLLFAKTNRESLLMADTRYANNISKVLPKEMLAKEAHLNFEVDPSKLSIYAYGTVGDHTWVVSWDMRKLSRPLMGWEYNRKLTNFFIQKNNDGDPTPFIILSN